MVLHYFYRTKINQLNDLIIDWMKLISFKYCIHVVHPYSSIDTTAAGKKLRFTLSVRSDFHMIDGLSWAVHAFVSRVSMSFSVDETLVGEFV